MKDQKPTPRGRGSFSLGDVLIERGKHRDEDIGDIWAEQKRIREQDALLEIEYRQAKEKAKQIKAKIKEHQIGDETLFGDDLKKYISKPPKVGLSKHLKHRAEHAQQTVRQLPRPTPLTRVKSYRPGKKQLALGVTTGLLVLGFVIRPLMGASNKSAQINDQSAAETLGQSTTGGAVTAPQEVTTTEFPLLYPAGVNPDNVKVVKINPENTATVYSYVDRLEAAQLRISQQRVPDNFKPGIDLSLQKLAESFNAKSIIQIDNAKVYHGRNEAGGTAQSLIFIKNDLLIFIAASQQQSDDKWAAYISSFN